MGETRTFTRSRGWLWTAFVCLVLLSGCVRPKCPRCGAMGGAANSKGPGAGGPRGGGRPGFPAHDNGGPGDSRDRAPAEDFIPPELPPGVPPGDFPPPGELPPFEDAPPFNDATATLTPTPTLSPTPTVTATPTVTPTTIPTFHACTTEQIDAAVQWLASPPTPAPGNAPSSPCDASSPLRLYCALVPKDESEKQFLKREDQSATKLGDLFFLTNNSPPACTDLGKACLERRDPKEPNGRTFLGYALRYGHDALARAMLSSSCALDLRLSSASPKDSPLTAVLNRLLEEARQCNRPPIVTSTPSEQTIARRLDELATLLDGPPPLPTIVPTVYYQDIAEGLAIGQKASTVPTAPPELVSVVRFASGGDPQTPQRTDSLEPISLLREIFHRCPAAQENALVLATALYRRGSGYPMFSDIAEKNPKSFECQFLTKIGRSCRMPPPDDPAPLPR